MLRIILLVLIPFVLVSSALSSPVYTWRDEEGRLHFSDRPMNGQAEKREVFVNDGPEGGQSRPSVPPAPASQQTDPQPSLQRQITASDYTIKPSLEQKGGYLYLSGRIEYGPPCKTLTVDIYAVSEHGSRGHITALVYDLDTFKSELLSGSTRVRGGDNRTRWNTSSIYVSCQD